MKENSCCNIEGMMGRTGLLMDTSMVLSSSPSITIIYDWLSSKDEVGRQGWSSSSRRTWSVNRQEDGELLDYKWVLGYNRQA